MTQNNSPFQQNFQPQPQQMFDSNSGLYQTDLPMQFAASVPHRPQPNASVNIRQPSYHSSESMIPCMENYSNSSFERPEVSLSAGGTSRLLQIKAERRAEHNATERARRENLNAKFQQLSLVLPNLQNDNRHSKVTIIDRTLDYVKESIVKEEQMMNRIKELEKLNSVLLSQLDDRSCKRKKSIQIDHFSRSVSPDSPTTTRSEDFSSVKEDMQISKSMTTIEQPPLTTLDEQTIGFFPAQSVAGRAPSRCSVSLSSLTPRTTHVNSWTDSNDNFQPANTHQKQKQMAYYDMHQLYMPNSHLNFNQEKNMNKSRFVEQKRYIPMTVTDQQFNLNYYK